MITVTKIRPDYSWAKFPKTRRVRKENRKKADTPEKSLQDYAENLLDLYHLPYLRLSSGALRSIFANPSVPIYVKKIVSDELAGWPDLMVIKKTSDAGINALFCAELKTEIGQLRASQKRRASDVSFVVLRSIEEIKKWVEGIR